MEPTRLRNARTHNLRGINLDLVAGELIAVAGVSGAGKSSLCIDTLYAAALARKPTRKEIKLANQLMVARKGDAISALQDIWWAVLNSNEFIINH